MPHPPILVCSGDVHKTVIVRRESEADVKRYVNCIFKTVRHILVLGLGHSWTASAIPPFGGREVGEAAGPLDHDIQAWICRLLR
jgi:hypothetical protein